MKQPSLIDELRERPYEFDFFQAVHILERADGNRVPTGMPPARISAAIVLARVS